MKSVPWKRFLIGLALLLVLIVMLAMFHGGGFMNVVVASNSMAPTFNTGDRLIFLGGDHYPAHGDIIAIDDPESTGPPLTKRVVAVEGDEVLIQAGRLHVNGEKVEEPYLPFESQFIMTGDLWNAVPEGHVFVLGDNRNNSHDSRDFGPVPLELILGRYAFRYWPLASDE